MNPEEPTGIKDVDAKFDPQTMIGGNLGLTQKQSHDWINNRGAFITYLQPIPINPEEREIHDAIERQRQSINIKESLEERKGSSGFMGISTANSNQNPLGATVTALPCRQ